MILTIYEQLNPLESDNSYESRVEWHETKPEKGSQVSMDDGESFSYQVVDVIKFHRTNDSQVDCVCMALVDRINQPQTPLDQWLYYDGEKREESITLWLSEVGRPELQYANSMQGCETPTLNQRLYTLPVALGWKIVDLDDGLPPIQVGLPGESYPTQWVADHFDTFIADHHTPYVAIYLTWCVDQPLEQPVERLATV